MKNTCKKLFRTSVFGGYKKKDVWRYVGKLEETIEQMEKQIASESESPHETSGKRLSVNDKTDAEETKEDFGNVIIFDDELQE